MKYFQPNFQLSHFSDITKEWLEQQKIDYIFSDLDSTLAVHGQTGDEGVEKWIQMLKENNITLAIISNNSQGRVDRFTKAYGIIGLGMSNKPATNKIKKYMTELGTTPKVSLFLGDQIFTDMWCGKRLGMKTALVKPIGEEHEPMNIRFKRIFERIIQKRW
jgi:HAD superfamily phosphatase (TIGR01668 family)